jgi:hypothetical protein
MLPVHLLGKGQAEARQLAVHAHAARALAAHGDLVPSLEALSVYDALDVTPAMELVGNMSGSSPNVLLCLLLGSPGRVRAFDPTISASLRCNRTHPYPACRYLPVGSSDVSGQALSEEMRVSPAYEVRAEQRDATGHAFRHTELPELHQGDLIRAIDWFDVSIFIVIIALVFGLDEPVIATCETVQEISIAQSGRQGLR